LVKGIRTFAMESEQFAGKQEITSELHHGGYLGHEGEIEILVAYLYI